MFKKPSFYIIFFFSLILFFNLTKINRVNLYIESPVVNHAIVDADYNISVQEIKPTEGRFRKVGVIVNGNFSNIKIKAQKYPYTMKLKNIIIVSTLFPFNISDKNLDKYFYFRNLDVEHQKGFNNINFKDGSSYLESRSILLNKIFLLRSLIVVTFAFVLTTLLILLTKAARFLPATLLITAILAPILLSPFKLFKLTGVQEKHECPVFSIHSFKKKTFQNDFETYLNRKLSFNNLHIKTLNTLLYYTLDKSFGYNQNILIGKNKILYEESFINLLCLKNEVNIKIINQVSQNIKKVQDYYEKQGKTFVVFITPGKAANYQVGIPNRFDITSQSLEKNYKAVINAFEENHINYIDARKYVKNNLDNHIFYPRSGTHWADYPKYLGAKHLLQGLNKYGHYNFEDLTINTIYKNNIPYGEDVDLAMLLDLLIAPVDYQVEHVCLNDVKTPSYKNVKVIGGSFWWGAGEMLNQAKVFKNLDVYFYLINYKKVFRNFLEIQKDNISDKNSLRNDINQGDIIILEINDCIVNLVAQAYIKEFINLILNEND